MMTRLALAAACLFLAALGPLQSNPPDSVVWTQRSEATGTDDTIAVPAGTQAGDLLIVFARSVNAASTPSDNTPAGWTQAGCGTTSTSRFCFWGRVASSDDAGTAYDFLDGTEGERNVIIVLNPAQPLAQQAIIGADFDSVVTNNDPTAQTVTTGSGVSPMVAVAVFISSGAFSSTCTGQDDSYTFNTNQIMRWAYLDEADTPVDVPCDMNDGGNSNHLVTAYFQVSK